MWERLIQHQRFCNKARLKGCPILVAAFGEQGGNEDLNQPPLYQGTTSVVP
jgi:hypothetical protein